MPATWRADTDEARFTDAVETIRELIAQGETYQSNFTFRLRAPFEGDAYSARFPKALQLPATLTEAAGRLRKSSAARELFGEAFVDHFAYTREWEEGEQRKAVTDWQLKRYFEIL